jgi:hypothetical protein
MVYRFAVKLDGVAKKLLRTAMTIKLTYDPDETGLASRPCRALSTPSIWR